jgi:hypothetical protein
MVQYRSTVGIDTTIETRDVYVSVWLFYSWSGRKRPFHNYELENAAIAR